MTCAAPGRPSRPGSARGCERCVALVDRAVEGGAHVAGGLIGENLDGAGFHSSSITRLAGVAVKVGDDARDALAAIELRMPPLVFPYAVEDDPDAAADVKDRAGA